MTATTSVLSGSDALALMVRCQSALTQLETALAVATALASPHTEEPPMHHPSSYLCQLTPARQADAYYLALFGAPATRPAPAAPAQPVSSIDACWAPDGRLVLDGAHPYLTLDPAGQARVTIGLAR